MKGNERLLQAIGEVDPALVQAAGEMGPVRRGHGRRALVIGLAAALVLTLGATAAAYYGDALLDHFAWRNGGDLTESQQATIEALTAVVDQSQTVDGWTVTVDRAIATRHDAYIMLDVTAPAGTVLDPEEQNYDCDVEISGFNAEDASEEGVTGRGLQMTMFKDEGMGENEGVILLELDRTATVASDLDLADGKERTVTVKDLRVWELDEESHLTEQTLVNGRWQFTFVLPAAEEIELLDGTVNVLAKNPSTGNKEDVGLSSLRLTALGATVEYITAYDYIQPFDDMTVTMADGSTVMGSGGTNSARDFGKVCSFQFDVPIDLGQVDHVTFQDVEIPMPK